MIEKILERASAKLLNLTFHKSERCKGFNEGIHTVIKIVQEVAKEYDWIPVEQKTPEDFTYVYVTCISLIDDRKPWVTEGVYNNATGWRGMAPMFDSGKAKVIAWMLKELPTPYQKGEQKKDCSTCANNTEFDELDSGCYMCCKGLENNYEPIEQKGD